MISQVPWSLSFLFLFSFCNVIDLDLLEDANEINECLGRSYGIGDEIDDADLEAELACLEDELEGEDLGLDSPAYLQPSSLPVQPTGAPLNLPAPVTAQLNQVDEFGLPVQHA